jgi:hypothetical protein
MVVVTSNPLAHKSLAAVNLQKSVCFVSRDGWLRTNGGDAILGHWTCCRGALKLHILIRVSAA